MTLASEKVIRVGGADGLEYLAILLAELVQLLNFHICVPVMTDWSYILEEQQNIDCIWDSAQH